jgi:phage gpG-like protein
MNLNNIGNLILKEISNQFAVEGDPKWKPSQRVIRFGGRTLDLTGNLKSSFTMSINNYIIEISTDVDYATYHQFGTKFMIPRPMINLNNIKEIILKEIIRQWNTM